MLLAIVIFLVMVSLLAVLHGIWRVSETKVDKPVKWWIRHFYLSSLIWPLYLLETAIDRFFWKGMLSIIIWIMGCLSIFYIILPPSFPLWKLPVTFLLILFGTFMWWIIAFIFVVLFRETKQSYPLAD